MVTAAADRLADYLAIREVFLQQIRRVRNMATRDEIHQSGRRLGLVTNGQMILGGEHLDCLLDWIVFQLRRQGLTLSQIAAAGCGPDEPPEGKAVLDGMAQATLGLFRVLRTEPGIGLEVVNIWTQESNFMFEREVSKSMEVGIHLLLRQIAVGTIVFSGSFTMAFPDPLLQAMRNAHAAGKLDSIDAITVPGPKQDMLLSSIIATLMKTRGPQSAEPFARDPKVGRNDPCPCGSGKKYKKCHGGG